MREELAYSSLFLFVLLHFLFFLPFDPLLFMNRMGSTMMGSFVFEAGMSSRVAFLFTGMDAGSWPGSTAGFFPAPSFKASHGACTGLFTCSSVMAGHDTHGSSDQRGREEQSADDHHCISGERKDLTKFVLSAMSQQEHSSYDHEQGKCDGGENDHDASVLVHTPKMHDHVAPFTRKVSDQQLLTTGSVCCDEEFGPAVLGPAFSRFIGGYRF